MSYEDSQSELTSKQTEDSSLLFIKDTEQSIDQ